MNLGDTVYSLIAGRNHRRIEAESPAAQVKRALAEAGGVSQLARSLGVARTTVQRWNKGSTPTQESQELLRAVLRRADLSQRRERALKMSDKLIVKGHQKGRVSPRVIDLGRFLRPGTMQKAVEAYLRGASSRDLWIVVWGGITDQSYRWLFQPPGGFGQMDRQERQTAVGRAFGPSGGSGGGGGGGGSGGGGGGSGGGGGYDDDDDLQFEDVDEDEDYGDYMDEYDYDDIAPMDGDYGIT